MRRSPVLAAVVLVVASPAVLPAADAPATPSECDVLVDELPVAGYVELSSCRTVDPRTVDIRQSERDMRSCRLPSGTTVEVRFVGGDLLNPRVRLTRDDETTRDFVLEPTIAMKSETFGTGPKLACDTGGRYYVAHPFVGYVSAFDPDANVLWRREPGGFARLDRTIESKEPSLSEVRNALETSTSTVSQLMMSGEYLAVEFRTGGQGTHQVFYHRSGVEVGRLGPWDGRLLEASPTGWRIVAGGGWDLRFYVPEQTLTVSVSGDPLPGIIGHALGWLQPRPTEKELRFQCLGRFADEVEHWVGDDFDADHAERARAALVALGGADWFAEVVASPALRGVIETFDPISPEWHEAYRRALVRAGVDVDVARALERSAE